MSVRDTEIVATRLFKYGAALAGLFGAFVAAASPAAACNHVFPSQTISRPDGTYVCHQECEMRGRGAREIRRITFTDRKDVYMSGSICMAACNSTPGCTGYTIWDWWEGDHQRMQCILFALSGPASTADRSTEGASNWYVCHRQPPGGLWRDPKIQIDRDLFQQDQYRPGVPGPSVPRK